MGKSKRKRRRRGGRSSKSGKSGVLLGMRSGFKNVAGAVTGTAEPKKGKSSWFGTAVLVLLVVAAAAFLFSRYH